MKPLSNIKVLDLTEGIPYIGSMFADYGAELIKIEPLSGDPIRCLGGESGPYSGYYLRAKQSIALDFTKSEGAEIVKRLAADCDMIVVSRSEEYFKQFGLGYDDLKAVNKRIIYGVLTPYGEEGPWKDQPDYDLLIMSKSGLQEKTGFPERPTKFGFPLGYFYSSWHLTGGMLAAYYNRLGSGCGCKVSVSTWQTVASLDDTFAECYFALGDLPVRIGNGFPTTNPTDTFRCKDGWFSLSIGSDDQWISFANVVGNKTWAEDPRYAHDPERSMENYFGDLDGQLRDFFATITISEADQICRDAMVPGGPCNTVKELVSDPQTETRRMIIEVNGEKQLGKPAKFLRDNEFDDEIPAAHELGADTEKYLAQLGIGEETLSLLRLQGIVL